MGLVPCSSFGFVAKGGTEVIISSFQNEQCTIKRRINGSVFVARGTSFSFKKSDLVPFSRIVWEESYTASARAIAECSSAI